MMIRPGRRRWVAWLALGLAPGVAGAGHAQVQEEGGPEQAAAPGGEPAPREISLAGLERVELGNGGEGWILPDAETPLVAVSVVLPASGAGGEGGLTRAVQAVVEGWAGACPGPGPRAVLRPGYAVVSLQLLSRELQEGLECLVQVLPGGTAESAESEGITGDEVGVAGAPLRAGDPGRGLLSGDDPREVATALLLEELYGAEHPYARGLSHGAGFLVVVAGGVDPGEAASLLAAAFAEAPWDDSGGTTPSPVLPPAGLEVVLLDRPGAPGVELRVGQLLMEGDHPEWTALTVGAEILTLAGEPAGEAPGSGSELAVRVLRNRGQGALLAGAAVPLHQAEATLTRFFREVEALRDRLVAGQVLGSVTAPLSGAFLRSMETPSQVAGQLAVVGALGLDPLSLEGYRGRLAALDPEALRLAVRRQLDPRRMVVVAVGDADRLEERLRSLGPVRRVEGRGAAADGAALDTATLDAAALDGTVLDPGRRVYRVLLRGTAAGEVHRSLERVGDTLRFTSVASLPGQRVEQVVLARSRDLAFLSGSTRVVGVDESIQGSLRREGGLLLGTLPGGEPEGVTLQVPDQVVVGDLLELAVAAAPLAPGSAFVLPVADAVAGRVVPTRVEVVEATRITVPAGTFPVFRVEVTGAERQTLWVLTERPHRVVRLASGTGGLVMELLSGEGGGGEGGAGPG